MTQNTYQPDDIWNWETVEAPLVEPYNEDRVAELVNNAFTVGPGGVGYLGTGPEDSLVGVLLLKPVDPQVATSTMATLTAIGTDPTRNNLTEEQQDIASIDTKIAEMDAVVTQITTPTTGYKDLLTNTAWNPLTQAQRTERLRDMLRGNPGKGILDDLVDISKAVKFLLKQEKKEVKNGE